MKNLIFLISLTLSASAFAETTTGYCNDDQSRQNEDSCKQVAENAVRPQADEICAKFKAHVKDLVLTGGSSQLYSSSGWYCHVDARFACEESSLPNCGSQHCPQ